MHRPRDELFPDAAFALDKHRERSGGGANDRLADAGHRLADTEQLGNRGGGPGFLAAGGEQRVHARRGDDGDEIEQFGGIGWRLPIDRPPARDRAGEARSKPDRHTDFPSARLALGTDGERGFEHARAEPGRQPVADAAERGHRASRA